MLGTGGQRWLKALHVTFVAFTLGGLLSILVLLMAKRQLTPARSPFLLDLAIYSIFGRVVTYSFYGILVTGLGFSLFTRWAFFRHHWITVKWVGVLIFLAFTIIWVGPAINGMVALSDAGLDLTGARPLYVALSGQSIRCLLIEGVLFVIIVFISVLKPWGARKSAHATNRKLVIGSVGTLAVLIGAFGVIGSLSIQRYRDMKIFDTDLSSLDDGTYLGQSAFGGFTYEAAVTVSDRRITGIDILANRESHYARLAEGVIPRIVTAQNANVDAITGATTTSKCLMKAVENAVSDRRLLE